MNQGRILNFKFPRRERGHCRHFLKVEEVWMDRESCLRASLQRLRYALSCCTCRLTITRVGPLSRQVTARALAVTRRE